MWCTIIKSAKGRWMSTLEIHLLLIKVVVPSTTNWSTKWTPSEEVMLLISHLYPSMVNLRYTFQSFFSNKCNKGWPSMHSEWTLIVTYFPQVHPPVVLKGDMCWEKKDPKPARISAAAGSVVRRRKWLEQRRLHHLQEGIKLAFTDRTWLSFK
jgi:hypothetical protein